jgi:hypothetical protein
MMRGDDSGTGAGVMYKNQEFCTIENVKPSQGYNRRRSLVRISPFAW